MDIKVRTKTKVSLIDCTHKNIGIYGKRPQGELNYVVASQGDKVEILGEYESEKRATEVLELIELSIDQAFKLKEKGIIIHMPEE